MRQSDDRDPEADIDVLGERPTETEASIQSQTTTGEAGGINDHQLLKAYSEGDEHAFETLVERYFRMVYAVAARQAGDLHLAEDVAQSVFLILSRKACGFSANASIPGWLVRASRFVCRDAIKMRRRRDLNERKLAMNLEHQHQSKEEPSTMQVLLDEAMQTLRPEEQAGIMARFFDGKDFQEIAQMFAISEHAARKRTSRCLAKLQSFMAKRGVKVSLPAIFSLVVAAPPAKAASQALQSAMHAAVWKGNIAAGNAAILAHHALPLLRWRSLAGLSLKVAVPAVVILTSAWSIREWNRPISYRIENLGRAWAAFDTRVAQHRQFMMQTPPTSPNYQAKVQAELGAISRESSRIIGRLNPLLASPDATNRLAAFLTAELTESLKLDPSQKAALFSYIEKQLAQGTTFKDAMKSLAQRTQSEAGEIKAMLTAAQQQQFDQLYGADGVLLFSYPKAVALGTIGP